MGLNTPELDKVRAKLADPRPYLEELGKQFQQIIRARFDTTKTDPDGRRWAPWNTATAQARRRAGSSASGLLLITGRLRDSTRHYVNGNKLTVTSTSPIAAYIQLGTRHMPGRKFIGYGELEKKATAALWSQWINSGK